MSSDWQKLDQHYERARLREDSLDRLVEYPAQRRAMGDINGKRILDIACGSGEKACEWASSGAREVYGFDISENFVRHWQTEECPKNLRIFRGDLRHIEAIPELKGKVFDVITSFQAVGYREDLTAQFCAIRALLKPGGRFVLSTAHPFRFVVEKQEATGLPAAMVYRTEGQHDRDSSWKPGLKETSLAVTFSSRINALINAGFVLEQMIEPELSASDSRNHPNKKAWMDKYFGIVIYVLRAI